MTVRPDLSSDLKKMEMIGTIGGFHLIVTIALKTRDAWLSVIFLCQTMKFLHLFRKQANHNGGF